MSQLILSARVKRVPIRTVPGRSEGVLQPAEEKLEGNRMPTFHFLDEAGRARIAAAAAEVLERVGVAVTEPEAQALLARAGAKVEEDRVHVPPALVENALETAPSTVTIYGRTGAAAMKLGANEAYFGAHSDAPDVLDPLTGERRPCQEADVIRCARLIDALPNLSFVTATGLVADQPAEVGDRVALARCLQDSSKPVLAMPLTAASVADCHRLAALAAGGAEALRQRPCMIVYAEPVSPLTHSDDAVRKILACSELEIPFLYSAFAAMGATAPMSPAAITAQLCAEVLSGLVIHQLKNPGAPFIFGSMASVMDMRTTVFSYGAPEFQRGNTLLAEMAHYFGLPNFGTAGTSDAQTLDGQAIAEATASCVMVLLCDGDLVHDVGLLGNATLISPEMIVATAEIIDMVRHLLGEVETDDKALALDVIADVGPGGEFVTHDHTFDHFRDVWYPTLFYRGGAKAWRPGESPTFAEQVRARVRELLETHRPAPLAADVVEAMEQIIASAIDQDSDG